MSQEFKDQLLVLVRFIFVFVFAALYAFGGIGHIWLRRFVAPIELVIGMFIFSLDWRVFLQLPCMIGGLCLPYGASLLWVKILKRFLFGLANGLSSSIYQIVQNNWSVVIVQISILIVVVIGLGVFNGLINARAEEFTIGCFIALIPMMSARRK